MVQNCLPPWGHRTCFSFGEQEAILLCQEKTRGNCVHSYLKAIFLCHVDGQPLGEVGDGGFGGTIGGYACKRAQGTHGNDVDDTTLAAFGDTLPEDLATLEGAGKIQVQDIVNCWHVEVKEGLFGSSGG